MKIVLLACVCSTVLLSGCAAFKSPSASQEKRNERNAATAESRRAQDEQERAMNDRASKLQRQGMSEAEARSAAGASSTGPKRSWP